MFRSPVMEMPMMHPGAMPTTEPAIREEPAPMRGSLGCNEAFFTPGKLGTFVTSELIRCAWPSPLQNVTPPRQGDDGMDGRDCMLRPDPNE